ncbi:MAG: hypothetical protein AVO33_04400 [delta proteobacterium ML8_F1]|nr:MAG: hypothetical protein AVO33_04400 [delta proteobacterium ML8_F1]
MVKRIVLVGLVLLLGTPAMGYGSVHEPVEIQVMGETLIAENAPFIENDRVYVLVREVSEALGARVDWVGETKEITLVREDRVAAFNIGSFTAAVDKEVRTMDATPLLIEERTYLPVRYLAEFLDFQVQWLADERLVKIELPENPDSKEAGEAHPYSKEDLLWLSRIVQVETGGASEDMMLGVANVVLNRVKSPLFPDTIHDVIFQVDVHTQFPPAHKASFTSLIPGELAIEMSRRALEGENNVETCLYFNNSPFRTKADDLYQIIDGEYFYY